MLLGCPALATPQSCSSSTARTSGIPTAPMPASAAPLLVRGGGRGAPAPRRRARADRRDVLVVVRDPRLPPPGARRRRAAPARSDGARDVRRAHPRARRSSSPSALVELTPDPLEHVFFADSGSVSVEVAIKMCLQYQRARDARASTRLLTLRGGYHGDTFGAMSRLRPGRRDALAVRRRARRAGLRAAPARRLRRARSTTATWPS